MRKIKLIITVTFIIFLKLFVIKYGYDVITINAETRKAVKDDKDVFIFFNRVPKCGSTTMADIIRELSKRNRFNIYVSLIHNKERLDEKGMRELKSWVSTFQETINVRLTSTVFFRHVNFVNFADVNKDVVYINILRDPVARFQSGFHYKRERTRESLQLTEACFGQEKLQSILTDIKKSWVDKHFQIIPDANSLPNNSRRFSHDHHSSTQCHTYYPGMRMVNFDLQLKDQLQLEFQPWLQKSFRSCVTNKSDPECHDFSSGRDERKGGFADIMLKRMAGRDNLIGRNHLLAPPFLYPSAVNYFCEEAPSSNEEGGEEAIATVDKHYMVLGVLEMMEETLAVLEKKLPRIFDGAGEIYKNMKKEGKEKTNSLNRRQIDEETRKVMAENLAGEYKLYNHAVRKLKQQYKNL